MREPRTENRPHATSAQDVPSSKKTPRRRLFFALWPTQAEQQRLAAEFGARIAASRGRAIPPANLHVTLAFLGGVEEARFAAVTRSAATVAAEPVTLSFDQLEIWPRAHVLCLTARTPVPLARLVEGLRFNLLNEQFEIRSEEEHRPHVTLARDVKGRGVREPIAPIAWRFEDFALVQSRPKPSGSQYEVIERWPLAR